MERIIDLRSDTVTRPSREMREAMASAEVGDDVLGDDPTVKRLEARMARLLGKEAAVYVPSGTMSNVLALLSQTSPGDEVILDRNCHIFNYEVGGAAVLGGLQLFPMDGEGGLLPIDSLPAAVRPANIHHPRTALVAVENTHNRAGGRVYPFDQLEAVSRFAHERRLRVHMDGARLANASVKTAIAIDRYGALVDSVTFCFSKGLGCPIGSILVSDAATIDRARSWRKRLGGGMRQVGILAAACLYALDHNVARLAEDHDKAARIGAIIERSGKYRLTFPVETNIVIFAPVDPLAGMGALERSIRGVGILAHLISERSMRMVTHLDVQEADIERIEGVLPRILEA
ncbi:MAG: low-specificity L-threonine aldolase [Candidatus Krumholzibacteria bacterium]|nr:low-specificity L-threonine aldolase [Candidatus Krumholzibacteria bacterium]